MTAPLAEEPQAGEPEEPALTNAHIVTLVELELGEKIIIEKIWEAPVVDFDLEVEELGALKDLGVSQEVIAQMLKRSAADRWPSTEADDPPDSHESAVESASQQPEPQRWSVHLSTSEGNRRLTRTHGVESSVFAFFTVLLYMDYPGHRAPVRTTDTKPIILLASREPPRGIYFLVRTDPSTSKGIRSVKMGQMKPWSTMAPSHPDPDWAVNVQVLEESPGIWRFTPMQDLRPGEYGIWAFPYGELYDFAVDPPKKKKAAEKGR